MILQDIGDPPTRMPWPPTPEGLLASSIDPISRTAIDVYAYGIRHAECTTHDSKVYQNVGDHVDVMYEAAGLGMNQTIKLLVNRDTIRSRDVSGSTCRRKRILIHHLPGHLETTARNHSSYQFSTSIGKAFAMAFQPLDAVIVPWDVGNLPS